MKEVKEKIFGERTMLVRDVEEKLRLLILMS
jgi:hypothetical protein